MGGPAIYHLYFSLNKLKKKIFDVKNYNKLFLIKWRGAPRTSFKIRTYKLFFYVYIGHREISQGPSSRRIGSGRIFFDYPEKTEADSDFGYRRERRDTDRERDERYFDPLSLKKHKKIKIADTSGDLSAGRANLLTGLTNLKTAAVSPVTAPVTTVAEYPTRAERRNRNGSPRVRSPSMTRSS